MQIDAIPCWIGGIDLMTISHDDVWPHNTPESFRGWADEDPDREIQEQPTDLFSLG